MAKRLRFFSHWQNLNECRHCGQVKGFPWHGRGWKRFYDIEKVSHGKEFSTEWYFFSRRNKQFTLSVEIGSGDAEDGVMLHLSVPFLFNLFFEWEGYLPSQVRKVDGKYVDFRRDYSLRYDFSFGQWGSLWWKWGARPDSWDSSVPRWREGSFDPADFVLGREKFSSETLDTKAYDIHLPEGSYPVRVTRSRDSWKRPRWPFPRVREAFEVKGPEKGVPVPGKGENSYDCDEDSVYSTYMRGPKSHDEAVDRFVADIEKTRSKYGGSDWRPTLNIAYREIF